MTHESIPHNPYGPQWDEEQLRQDAAARGFYLRVLQLMNATACDYRTAFAAVQAATEEEAGHETA